MKTNYHTTNYIDEIELRGWCLHSNSQHERSRAVCENDGGDDHIADIQQRLKIITHVHSICIPIAIDTHSEGDVKKLLVSSRSRINYIFLTCNTAQPAT